ncbi:L-ascorbate metabolism protein UlaG, beta-lactamase superfamily [Lachnospiraceae bacterium]|nr:L-ascorbate metabolism protein UlaG, beta-lactamase superfamily [Lachnospiraceae bacterium]
MTTDNIKVLGHNSIRISAGNITIYVDPFQLKQSPKDADYIFITHDHYDHFSPEDIEKVSCDHTILVVPCKMEDKAHTVDGTVNKIITVETETHREFDGFEVSTVPAYNILKPFHPKSAGWVGYIIRLDGKSIYVAGDTDATKEAKNVKCDIALVPVGGTYTMDAKKAAELVNIIRPETAIPVHYGSIVGKPSDGEVFAEKVEPSIKVELKIEF